MIWYYKNNGLYSVYNYGNDKEIIILFIKWYVKI